MSVRRASDAPPDSTGTDEGTDPAATSPPSSAESARSGDAPTGRPESAVAAPGPDAGPTGPTGLDRKSWMGALRRTITEFSEDNVSDWAAALTYYGVLAIFPGILVLVSLLGLIGADTTATVQHTIKGIVPAGIGTLLDTIIGQVRGGSGGAGLVAIFGLLVAFWSASGYIAAFMRASNSIYDVPEGRPIWKTLPIRLGVTAVIGIMLIAASVIVVFTGSLARTAGNLIGLGPTAVAVWNVAKWPVLVLIVSLMFAILYWASPNAQQGGFRWVTPGGLLAVLLWLVASGAFAVYLGNFASYNKTYGTFGAIISFLVWLWISNMAILLGAELDAELERGRAIAAGHPADAEPFLRLRDDRKLKKGSQKGLGTS